MVKTRCDVKMSIDEYTSENSQQVRKQSISMMETKAVASAKALEHNLLQVSGRLLWVCSVHMGFQWSKGSSGHDAFNITIECKCKI